MDYNTIKLTTCEIGNESFLQIANHDYMRPFFMSLVSNANHWLFVSSNGGLTAGRINADNALFPYYTDDKLTELAHITGSKTLFRVAGKEEAFLWEPFIDSNHKNFEISRNIYKSVYGNKLMFEEINHTLNLRFTYMWCFSDEFGIVKKSAIYNLSPNPVSITILDGIQNILPQGVNSLLQNSTSNLVDAYKRNELDELSGMGIFALSAYIVDKAEPGESLKANVAWAVGLSPNTYLMSSLQLNNFRNGIALNQETDIKGEKGAYFIQATIQLAPQANQNWYIVADVNKSQAQVVELQQLILQNNALIPNIEQDITLGTQALVKMVAAADGIQRTADRYKDYRHFANVLFNIMRGGIFQNNYQIDGLDLFDYLSKANKALFKQQPNLISLVKAVDNLYSLEALLSNNPHPDLYRLAKTYLPLQFSRRHGDPSRPWNKFTINTQNQANGAAICDYEGNWRDIFQNWEALAHSYPMFTQAMVFKFLNTSTFDGYNPYRVTKDGFDWETIEPDNPWSYIGYWGDHQVIYLQKLLEALGQYQEVALQQLLANKHFVYAHVPYRIKDYQNLVKDPKNTITFDHKLDTELRNKIELLGGDGALVRYSNGDLVYASFIEKLLVMVLTKISNFIPEAGIWMNTQRPEWNDANNALVGNGASLVTLAYVSRFCKSLAKTLNSFDASTAFDVSTEVSVFFDQIFSTLTQNTTLLNAPISAENRKRIIDALGTAGSDYRINLYENGFSGNHATLSLHRLQEFLNITLQFIKHSIEANLRADNLYHAYNLVDYCENGVEISRLDPMLEGQVAILSAQQLADEEVLTLLKAMQKSALYRDDQNSYLLYPNKELPKFLSKNVIRESSVGQSKLLNLLIANNNKEIVERDASGKLRFNSNFRNADDFKTALVTLRNAAYSFTTEADFEVVLAIFEETFNHKAFTGRSGTFYAYEGLGSIYWHMVSKLHLAIQENLTNTLSRGTQDNVSKGLFEALKAVEAGIGMHKSPALYGAFPTDPYSHTPLHKGAQQPGMTGQVKEDILVRFAEFGVHVKNGELHFVPGFLTESAFIEHEYVFNYIDVYGQEQKLTLPAHSLAFTRFQVPFVFKLSTENCIHLQTEMGNQVIKQTSLPAFWCQKLLNRSGEIHALNFEITKEQLFNQKLD